jgi:malate dehydrogenase (oxaloacetate-decarboxylating)
LAPLAAADAIADVITEEEWNADYIVPSVFDRRVAKAVAEVVAQTAREVGVAGRLIQPATHSGTWPARLEFSGSIEPPSEA